jgi:catechol 2,3-dioxygenase-like lactoylglutathione lyase family enzyme
MLHDEDTHMAKVIGPGGVFFKARDPAALSAWYAKHLGLDIEHGGARFSEDPLRACHMLWSPFPADTEYFEPTTKSCMINFRVDDLDALLARLRADGVTVDERTDESEFGRFGCITDPDGMRVELRQPPAAQGRKTKVCN